MSKWLLLIFMLAWAVAGWFARGWYGDHLAEKAQATADAHTTRTNQHTSTADIGAATHIQAVAAGGQTLDRRTEATRFGIHLPGVRHAAANPAACVPLLLPDDLADPRFWLQYDAGADPASAAGQAHDVPASGP